MEMAGFLLRHGPAISPNGLQFLEHYSEHAEPRNATPEPSLENFSALNILVH